VTQNRENNNTEEGRKKRGKMGADADVQ